MFRNWPTASSPVAAAGHDKKMFPQSWGLPQQLDGIPRQNGYFRGTHMTQETSISAFRSTYFQGDRILMKKTTQRLKKMTGTPCLTSKYRGFSMVFLFFLSPNTGVNTILTGQTGQTMNPSMFVVKTFQNRHKIPSSSHVHDLLGSTWWLQPENYESQLGLSSCCLHPHQINLL